MEICIVINVHGKYLAHFQLCFFHVQCFPFCCFFSTEVVFRNGFQRTTLAARTMQATMIMKMVETHNSWKNIWDSITVCRLNLDHLISNEKLKWIDRIMCCMDSFFIKHFNYIFILTTSFTDNTRLVWKGNLHRWQAKDQVEMESKIREW